MAIYCCWRFLSFCCPQRELIKLFSSRSKQRYETVRRDLVGTLPQDNNTLTKSVKVTMGNAQSETHFYLVTDALAGWIFKTLESEKNPWHILDNINTQKEFIGWLDDLRVSREIRNDDTKMIHFYLVD